MGERGTGRDSVHELDQSTRRRSSVDSPQSAAISRLSALMDRLSSFFNATIGDARVAGQFQSGWAGEPPGATEITEANSVGPVREPRLRVPAYPVVDFIRTQHWLSAVFDAVLAVALSPSCASCGGPLEHPTRGPVCAACWQSILPLTPPLCDRCGDPLRTWRAAAHPSEACARCRRLQPTISRARAIGAYDGALRAIIHSLKYDSRRSLAVPLGALMRDRGAAVLADAACAVPVPLHRRKQRERGFNQAADLAWQLQLPVLRALRRSRATAAQTGLPAARRNRYVRDAFVVTRAARALRGQVVVLVDDVCTTGATLEACARALKAAGAVEVRAITAARVVAQPR
jgi:ComF family protein